MRVCMYVECAHYSLNVFGMCVAYVYIMFECVWFAGVWYIYVCVCVCSTCVNTVCNMYAHDI